jgi:hypothetical protein
MQRRALTSLILFLLLTGLVRAEEPMGPATDPPAPTRNCWVDCEALLWWMKGANLPPLVASSPVGTARTGVAILGTPGTSVVFGGSAINSDLRVGGRLTAGLWLDCNQTIGVEGSYFQLGTQAARFSDGTPDNLGRPFISAVTGRPAAELISATNFLVGNTLASASSSSLIGAGALARANLCCGCVCCDGCSFGYRLDALAGYRYLSMSDQVGVIENLTSTDPAQTVAPLGTNIVVTDRFHTNNQFHGGDIGLAGELRYNAWTLRGTARVALGTNRERVDISGATISTVPGTAPVVSAGGLLALSSNSGSHSRDMFAVVPEARLQLGYQVTNALRVHVGYSFLYWSQIARAGDQIDLVVNPALLAPPLPGASPLRPAFAFQGTGFWAQGIDLGFEFRF